MTTDTGSDHLTLPDMSRLHVLTSDERRAERVRARCRARLARHIHEEQRLGPALIAGLCVVYLSAVVHSLFRMRGMF